MHKFLGILVVAVLLSASISQAQTTRPDFSKQKVLYAVGYAHLDTQWRWTYPQVIREFIRNTMEQNFPLIEKYPDYIFNFTGARRYQFMMQYFPEDFKKVQEYVHEGRWFPAGASVDECDTDSPSAESLVRQILYGNEFFQKEFGVTSNDLMLPDTFGFTAALPEICAHCGLKGFSTQKLTWGSAIGIPFKVGTWEGPDGRSIIAALDPGSYTGVVDGDLSNSSVFLDRINKTGQESGSYVDYRYYGTGDRGGAPKETSVQALEGSIHGNGPVTVIAARSDQMFNDLTDAEAAKLPHYKGELLLTWHSTGSISSESAMKRWNRKNELLADAAERASVAASWLGAAPYPAERLWTAWMMVLGSQMHDMMAGTAMANAYDYIWNDELLALNQFDAITQDAVGAVAANMNTTAQGVSIVVYNPLAFSRTDVADATVTYPTADTVPPAVRVVGPDGKEVLSQVLGHDGNKLHILFVATVPSVGFAAYDIQPGSGATRALREVFADATHIENGRFRVTLNEDGDISSIFDKLNKREVFKTPSRLEFLTEHPTQYPAWNMYWEDQQRPPRAYVGAPVSVRMLENGPVRATLEVTREAEGSKFVQQIRLAAGGDGVEIVNTIDWQTPESALKASFPLSFGNPMATYDCQISALQRGNDDPKKFEVPQQQWFNLDDPSGSFGVAVLNDCKYGSDKPNDSTLRLTLLYTPRARPGTSHDQATQDMGREVVTYSIAPHSGDWRQANVPHLGARLNQPLLTFQSPSHDGRLGATFSLLNVNSDHVAVQAIKKAEQGDEVIVRLRETEGQAADNVVVSSPGTPFISAREVDGQERPLGPATLDDRGELVVDLTSYSLRAFALKFGPNPAPAAVAQATPVNLDYNVDAVSSTGNPKDGGLDVDGHTYPAEEWPTDLTVDGIPFHLGSAADGEKNAVICHGQEISLAGTPADRVYLLAAAVYGDRTAEFRIGDQSSQLRIQDWSTPIGEWDRRLWSNPIPDIDYGWNNNECVGLIPGFVKPAEVAWFSTHRHEPSDGNEFYHLCYLFKYDLPIPSGAKTLVLPNDPKVVVLAVSVGSGGHDQTVAATPLSDTLTDRAVGDGPTISPAGGSYNDNVAVTIQHPLYWKANEIRYTLDGTDPTAQSPTYSAPIDLDSPATIKTAMVDEKGDVGSIATATFDVHDVTPPKVTSAFAFAGTPIIDIAFSKRVDAASAQSASNYHLNSGPNVAAAAISDDGRDVQLSLDRPLAASDAISLTISGIHDRSPSANAIDPAPVAISVAAPVYSMTATLSTTRQVEVDNLPTHGSDAWTLNLYCRPRKMPANKTLIAGFGGTDAQVEGQGRYLSKFPEGVHFWSNNEDVPGNVRLDVNKWQMLTVTFDGHTVRIYKNGALAAHGNVSLRNDDGVVNFLPLDPWDFKRSFDGEVRNFTIWSEALPDQAVKALDQQ